MKSKNEKKYEFTINKLAMTCFVVLIMGVGIGLIIPKVDGLRSKANSPCATAWRVVQHHVDTLLSRYSSKGLIIPDHLMLLLEDYVNEAKQICADSQSLAD